MPPVIGFVGFGEAARCFAAHFAQSGIADMPVFCDGPTNHPPYSDAFRAEVAAMVEGPVDDLADLAMADVILSAVLVATALPVGLAIAAAARPGALLVDINASTPGQKRQVAAACAVRGIGFVDANLMGAVSLYGARVPLYCSGDGVGRFAEIFGPLGLVIEEAGPEAGAAAAVKMLRSVVTKGMEALLVEALTAASLAGVRAEALRGICAPMDATRFSSFADMCIRTDVLHAERRAVEMEGVVEGIAELGLDPVMTRATASRLRASAALGLRADFAARADYDADAVLDAYAAAGRPAAA